MEMETETEIPKVHVEVTVVGDNDLEENVENEIAKEMDEIMPNTKEETQSDEGISIFESDTNSSGSTLSEWVICTTVEEILVGDTDKNMDMDFVDAAIHASKTEEGSATGHETAQPENVKTENIKSVETAMESDTVEVCLDNVETNAEVLENGLSDAGSSNSDADSFHSALADNNLIYNDLEEHENIDGEVYNLSADFSLNGHWNGTATDRNCNLFELKQCFVRMSRIQHYKSNRLLRPCKACYVHLTQLRTSELLQSCRECQVTLPKLNIRNIHKLIGSHC